MKSFLLKFIAIFSLVGILSGCEFSLKPPGSLKKYFKTEADSRYYERKCKDLLKQINVDLERYGIRRIAVIDFVDIEGRVSELGRFLSSELILQVPKESEIIVIQRGHVEEAMRELRIVPMESYDFQKTNELGAKLGVDGIVFGKLVDLGTNIDANLRMIDVNTGDVVSTASASLARSKYAVEMSNRFIGASD